MELGPIILVTDRQQAAGRDLVDVVEAAVWERLKKAVADGTIVPCDRVVVGVGVKPAAVLFENNGLN